MRPNCLKLSGLAQFFFLAHRMRISEILPYSLVENQNDLELDCKVFCFVDYCFSGIVPDESNWCHFDIIERFEIFKMASKMANS